jgi:alanyl-tRNA synthetase
VSERLYLADPYLTRFQARVARQARLGDRAAVVLDRTAFYPEGGGQPADRGTIGGVAVVDVQEQDGEILHALAGPAPSGSVEGVVDWGRRFDHMQQHHGQHLLSAAFEHWLGAHTVSFHLGEVTCTIDLDVLAARLDEKALREVEAAANQAVWRDLPVTAIELAPEEMARLPLRKEPTKGSRVVVVGDLPAALESGGPHPLIDASPCGGTHPRRTGEVGAVAVLGARKWGEGARVEFVCGGRVVRALAGAEARLAAAAQALRCAPAEVGQAAARVAEEALGRRKEVERLVAALAAEAGERLAAGAAGPLVARLEPPLSGAAGLKAAAAALAARGRVALLGGEEAGRAFLCFARPKGTGPHLGDLVREAAAALGGKGGGSPELAQGSGPEAARLAEALELARGKLSSHGGSG